MIAAVLAALARMPGLRPADAGEFTRRAFVHGRIDLAEAEGLADLLAAETELQRRAALAMADGGLSRLVEGWRQRLLGASARIEALLDFADEDDPALLSADFSTGLSTLRSELAEWLERPRAKTLREGFRIVIAGPPNAGKSTLFNVLVEDDAAITAPLAGTTRDMLTRSVAIAGVPLVFADTAGLRAASDDAIEVIGMARAREAMTGADVVLWLGREGEGPPGCWDIDAQADIERPRKRHARHRLSAVTGEGIEALRGDLVTQARSAMPRPGVAALTERQHALLGQAARALAASEGLDDPLLLAEELRTARQAFDALLGRTATEDMLDTLFNRFCIGK